MFIVNLKKSVIVTYVGVICGVVAMAFAFTKMAFAEVEYLRYSLVLLILAGICDMFDGKIARMCDRTQEEKEFGIQIDSLADTVNFLALPVVIMLSLGMTSVFEILVYTIFVLCGISRLALFNCNADLDSPVKHYTGLPVTTTAIFYPIAGLLHGQVPHNIFNLIYIIGTLVIGILFITNIKVPKFKNKVYYIGLPIFAAFIATLLLVVK